MLFPFNHSARHSSSGRDVTRTAGDWCGEWRRVGRWVGVGGRVDRAVGAGRARGSVQGSGLALAFLRSRIPRTTYLVSLVSDGGLSVRCCAG